MLKTMLLGYLHDDGVACSKGRAQLPSLHPQGEVPGNDLANDACNPIQKVCQALCCECADSPSPFSLQHWDGIKYIIGNHIMTLSVAGPHRWAPGGCKPGSCPHRGWSGRKSCQPSQHSSADAPPTANAQHKHQLDPARSAVQETYVT